MPGTVSQVTQEEILPWKDAAQSRRATGTWCEPETFQIRMVATRSG